MSDIKEFHVDSRNFFRQTIQKMKEFLKDNKKGKIVANTHNADQATGASERLRREGYIEFDDVKTETRIIDNTRNVQLIITVHTTENFDKLFKESEEERKNREEERKKRIEEKQKERESKEAQQAQK